MPTRNIALSEPWRSVVSEAIVSWQMGAWPIGAAVVDMDTGRMMACEGNRMIGGGTILDHAEMRCFGQIALADLARPLALYVSTEPCPMCFGAANVARAKELHVGIWDPWAGSTDIDGSNWYLKYKPIQIFDPEAIEDTEMEDVLSALTAYCVMKCGTDSELAQRWNTEYPVIRMGTWLRASREFEALRASPNWEPVYEFLAGCPWGKEA